MRLLNIALIDHNKAFDSLNNGFMVYSSKRQEFPYYYIDLIPEMYSGLKEEILMIRTTILKNMERSKILSNCALKGIFRESLSINGERPADLSWRTI